MSRFSKDKEPTMETSPQPGLERIETERLELQPVSREHASSIYNLITESGDLHIHTHIPEQYTPEHAEGWTQANEGNPYFFVITDRETREAMGVISVVEFDMLRLRAEVGFWLGKKFRGNNFMSEAVRAMSDDIFGKTPIRKIVGRVFECNDSSINTFLDAGFTAEAVLPKHGLHQGEMKDVILFGLDKKE